MIVHEGHTELVRSVAFSPDGKSVASGSGDDTIRIWGAKSSISQVLRGHSSPVNSVSYSPLGNLVASGSTDRTIRLWDTKTGQESGVPLRGMVSFLSVAFSPNARLIASGSADPTAPVVQLWDVKSRTPASGLLEGHTDQVWSVSFSPDSTRLVSGSHDETICVWDVERGTTIIGPLEGHTGWVHSTSFSPDSAQIISCSFDGTIRLWDTRNGKMVGEPYKAHTGGVWSVAYSPRGTYVASGGNDNAIRLWDLRTGGQVDVSFKEHTSAVLSVAFSPCGQYVASGSMDRKVIIQKASVKYSGSSESPESQIMNSQMSTQQMFECLRWAGCIDLSSQMDTRQESARIMSGGGFGDIWKGRLHNGTEIAIKAWRTNVLDQCDNKTLKRAAKELYLWSRMDHPNIHRLQGVVLFRDQYLGMVSEWMGNGNLHEYLLKHPNTDRYELCHHVASGLEYMHSLSMVHGDLKAINVLVSSDGIARLSDFGSSVMSEASNPPPSESSTPRRGTIRWAAPEILIEEILQKTPETDVYALGMTMLEIFTGEVPYSNYRPDFNVVRAVLNFILPSRPIRLGEHQKDDKMWQLMISCWSRDPSKRPSSGGVVEAPSTTPSRASTVIPGIRSPKSRSDRTPMIVHEGHTSWVNSVAFSPDGKSVASGSWDNTIRTWNAHSKAPIGEPLRGHSGSINSVSYSPLGNLIASGSMDKTIRLWDSNTGQQLDQSLRGDNPFISIAFSPNTGLIASGSGGLHTSPTGHAVQLWDVQSGTAMSIPFKGHTGGVESVSFSPDGTRVVSGSFDRTIRVWDFEHGVTILGPLEGHTKVVRSTAFSPDGSQIVSCSIDRTIRFWDARSGAMIGEPYNGHTDWVNSVSFSPRGTYVASGGNDNTVRLWDIRTGRQVGQPFEEHTGCVYSVVFSPSSRHIASGSYDHKVIIRRHLGEDLDSDDDNGVLGEPRMVTSQMSIREIFDILILAGCRDLSSDMDTGQDTARIASGGGFGDIWKGQLYNGEYVAIKAWRTYALGPPEYKTLKRAARELYIWSRMDHPHIHTLQGVIVFRDQYLGMVSDWMDNGNLHKYLAKNPHVDRYQLCAQVASGLEYMHGCGVVHGDLKALNVLVSSDGIAKLSDFDFSVMSEVSGLVFTATSNTRAVSVRWTAPEILGDDTAKRTTQADVYALGMTMLEIFTGDVPYAERRIDGAVIMAMMMNILPTRPVEHIKDDARGNIIWQLLLDCWSRNPSERPSAGQVLKVLESLPDEA